MFIDDHSYLTTDVKDFISFVDANIFFVVMAFISACVIILAFRPTYRRMRAEQESAAQRILGFNSSNSPNTEYET